MAALGVPPAAGAREVRVKWKWKLPGLLVLGLLFVVPHDPSSQICHVGSHGFVIQSMAVLRAPGATRALPSQHARKVKLRVHHAPLALGLVTQPTHPLADYFNHLVHDQLNSRHMREMRVAKWRVQRMLHRLSDDVTGMWHSNHLEPELHEWPQPTSTVFTSLEELTQAHGGRRSWFGDLDMVQTRNLYHSLLPYALLEDDSIPLATRARIAVRARRAAKLYVRERSMIPVTLWSMFYDGFRNLVKRGTFQPNGMSEEEYFHKYADEYTKERGLTALKWADTDIEDSTYDQLYWTILQKSCSTDKKMDGFSLFLARAGDRVAELGIIDALHVDVPKQLLEFWDRMSQL